MSPLLRGAARDRDPGNYPLVTFNAGLDTDTAQCNRERHRHRSYGTAALDSEMERVEAAPEGHRHHTLACAARRMGELVAGGELVRRRAEQALAEAGRIVGIPHSETLKAIRWGMVTGGRSPRHAPTQVRTDRYDQAMVWVDWWADVDHADFPGTKGSTRLRVLAAIYLAGVACGRPEVGLSYRQIAEASGLALSTVTPLLKRGGLLSGHIRAVHRPRPHQWHVEDGQPQSSRWAPVHHARKFDTAGPRPALRTTSCTDNARISPAGNLWVRRGNAWRVRLLLDDEEEVTVASLAAGTGLHPGSVRRVLATLAELGYAERVTRTTWRGATPSVAPPDVASDGRDHVESRRLRYARERYEFAVYRRARLRFMAGGGEHLPDQRSRSRGPTEGWRPTRQRSSPRMASAA